jgi:hypothetical protein
VEDGEQVIEINETQPVEASLTIVLRGADVDDFKALINHVSKSTFDEGDVWTAKDIWGAIS